MFILFKYECYILYLNNLLKSSLECLEFQLKFFKDWQPYFFVQRKTFRWIERQGCNNNRRRGQLKVVNVSLHWVTCARTSSLLFILQQWEWVLFHGVWIEVMYLDGSLSLSLCLPAVFMFFSTPTCLTEAVKTVCTLLYPVICPVSFTRSLLIISYVSPRLYWREKLPVKMKACVYVCVSVFVHVNEVP